MCIESEGTEIRLKLQCQEITKNEQRHFNLVFHVHNILVKGFIVLINKNFTL